MSQIYSRAVEALADANEAGAAAVALGEQDAIQQLRGGPWEEWTEDRIGQLKAASKVGATEGGATEGGVTEGGVTGAVGFRSLRAANQSIRRG